MHFAKVHFLFIQTFTKTSVPAQHPVTHSAQPSNPTVCVCKSGTSGEISDALQLHLNVPEWLRQGNWQCSG